MKKNYFCNKKFRFIIIFVLVFLSACPSPAANLREKLYLDVIKRTYDLIKGSFYRDAGEETLISGAYSGMKKVSPGLTVPPECSLRSFEKFYLDYCSKNPREAGKAGEAALDGMVESLGDPYSSLLTPEKSAKLHGDGSGIGLELGFKNGRVTVIAPVAGSSAYKSGIRNGDVLEAVNGKSVAGMSLYKASMYISGKKGSKIAITVKRGGEKKTFHLVFGKLDLRPVSSMILSKNIGYIRINIFSGRMFDGFVYALKILKKKNVKGLIIDLRDNPGGDLEESLRIGARFVPSGPLIWIQSQNGRLLPERSGSGESFPSPVVILVNEGTASAAEVLASSVSGNGKATLMGRRTFGKGVIQTAYNLTGGAKLILTTESYLTPKKEKINGTGIEPDIVLPECSRIDDPVKDPWVIEAWRRLKK